MASMKGQFRPAAAVIVLLGTATGCADQGIVGPAAEPELAAATAVGQVATANAADDQACWGQATAVFAALGVMRPHASKEYDTPREGVRNLACSLYAAGLIADDSMQALGEFVATAENLSIDACM
ncbi:MAG TPA: hypothetical protein VFZ69_07485 [Longimicrobiales bacterium]